MQKVAIVIPYFGSWPEWFDIFLETCKYNGTIKWIFFTDCKTPKKTPKNVQFESLSLEEFNCLASKKTGLKTKIKRAYKVCDFRPVYAEIFEQYLTEFEFWGWGDIDVIYGDLDHIFRPKNLEKYDIISARRRRTAGVLTVLRNTRKMNKIYRKSPDHEKILEDEIGYAFDEKGVFKDRRVVSMTEIIKGHAKSMEINYLFWDYAKTDKKMNKEDLKMYWRDGKIYNSKNGKEVYLYHFLDRKENENFHVPKSIDPSNGFLVGRNGIREVSSSYSVPRKPLSLAAERLKDKLRWTKDRIAKDWYQS